MSMHSLSLLNPVFSFEIPGSARVWLPILPTLFKKCAPYWSFGRPLVVLKKYVGYVLRSLNIYAIAMLVLNLCMFV